MKSFSKKEKEKKIPQITATLKKLFESQNKEEGRGLSVALFPPGKYIRPYVWK